MTIKELKKYIKKNNIPDDAEIYYHAYYKGCCLSVYEFDEVWIWKKDDKIEGLVMNPCEDYDER